MKNKLNALAFWLSKRFPFKILVGIVFQRLSWLLPLSRLHDSQTALAFIHPRPHWEKHFLVVPKLPISAFLDLGFDQTCHKTVFLELLQIAQKIILDSGWKEYNLLLNGGLFQEVPQLHLHLFSGRVLRFRAMSKPSFSRPKLVSTGNAAKIFKSDSPNQVQYLICPPKPFPALPFIDLPQHYPQILELLKNAYWLVSSLSPQAFTLYISPQTPRRSVFHLRLIVSRGGNS